MDTDYSVAVLSGLGDTDYARYMQTDTLLSLQRRPEDMVHRDELLFQTVHQSTELWLKHACFEVDEAAICVAAGCVAAGDVEVAVRLLARGSLALRLITGQLDMLRHLSPWAFQSIRTVLGHGSGFESPGWQSVKRTSRSLGHAFEALVLELDVDLTSLYRASLDAPLYRLAESMIDWDEQISLWRVQHYKLATRMIGHGSVGTKGTPVDVLAELISHKFFPELWKVRSLLTATGPMATPPPSGCPGAVEADGRR